MVKRNTKNRRLPKPKITFDRFGQIFFTFKEATKFALRAKPKLLILIFILNAIWGFSAVPGFYLEKLIIDKLIEAVGKPDLQIYLFSIGGLVALALLLSLFRNFLGRFNGFLRRTMSRYFEVEITMALGRKLSQLDMATIDNPQFQDRYNKVERESGRRAWGLMMPLSDIPNYLVGFIASASVLVFLHPLIAVGVFVVALPQILINSKFIKKEYELHTQLSPLRRIKGWINFYLLRNQNYMELKILNIADTLSAKFKKVSYEMLEKIVELSKKSELSRVGTFIPLSIYEFCVSIMLIFWVIIQKITVGSFQLYLRSLRSAEQNLTSLVSSFLEIYENYIYVTDLVWFLNLEPEISKSKRKILMKEKKFSIELNNVWFKYQTDHPWVLKDINYTINPGERIALVGENGAGKTTLIRLIAGFYTPQKGKVLVNNNDLKEIDIRSWRERLAILFQRFETYMFSARESIGYGDINRINRKSEIVSAAKDGGAHEFIQKLPLKYNTPLTPRFEKGIRLSTGQKQRIGISRMLFRKSAGIIILDEPTSNVDPEAEEKIFKMLLKKTQDKILIFVTQRFSTVRIADRILVVDKGKIIEQGTHKQLMAKKGKYAKMFTLQAQAYLDS